jgi:hypothetical protein
MQRTQAEARRLTRETGVQHVVDHKRALALGGTHGKEPAGHSGDGELQEGAGRDASRDRAEGATTYCGWKETAT